MPKKGLFNKVKNKPTRRRFLISTIKKAEDLFETAVFEANFFYLPRNWPNAVLTVETQTQDAAWETHYRLTSRFTTEYPARLIAEYHEQPPA